MPLLSPTMSLPAGSFATLCLVMSLVALPAAAQGRASQPPPPASAAQGAAGKSAPSKAAPTKEQIDAARDAYNLGLEKLRAGESLAAYKYFKQADDLIELASVRARVADALAALGRLVEAREVARSVADIPPRPNASVALVDARRRAAELANALTGSIPTLVFRAPAPGITTTVTVDDKPVSPQHYGGYPVDPGAHTVTIVRPGAKPVTTVVTLSEGQRETIRLAPAAAAPPPPAAANSDGGDDAGGVVMGPVAWTGVAVTGVGLLVGAVAGGITLSRSADLEPLCTAGDGNDCPPPYHQDREDTLLTAHVSTAGIVVAGLGAGVALLGMFVIDAQAETAATPAGEQVRLVPLLGPGVVGLRGAF